jgi:hypothetical protein
MANATAALRALEVGGRSFSSASAVVVGSFGGAFGSAILLYDRAGWPARNVAFSRSGSFLLWAVILVAQPAIWAVAVAFVWSDLVALKGYVRTNRREIVESAAMISVLTGICFAATARIPAFPPFLPHHELKILIIATGGWVAGTIAATGIWLVHGAFKEMCDPARAVRPADLARFLDLRRRLQRFLLVTGSIVGLAILGAGAERNMVDAYVHEYGGPSGFPIEYVLIYGLFFTGLLAFVYFPTQLTMMRVAERIRDRFYPLPDLRDAAWDRQWAQRSTLEGILGIDVGPGATFKAAIGVLTPLLASLTGLLLNAH